METSAQLLRGKHALVTGGASGIGLAISETLAREGAQVLITDIDLDQGAVAAERIKAQGGSADCLQCDVVNSADVRRAIAHPEHLDCVVNNAGVAAPHCDITAVDEDSFDQVISVNVKGAYLVLQAAVERMRRLGGGAIVNIASVGGVVGTPGITPYSMSKHAVVGLTRGAAVEQSQHGIRINAVCPGPTHTPMIERYAAQQGLSVADLGADLPLRRISTPQEVAEAVVWLCSDKSSATTGALLMVDGGYTAQ